MKLLRFFLFGLAIVAVLLAVVAVLLFTPGVQTWAARKFAPSTPAFSLGIGRIDAGLKTTRVEDIRIEQPGLVLTLPSAEIEVGVIDAAGGKVEVKRLVAKGWTLELTNPPAGPASATLPPSVQPAIAPAPGATPLVKPATPEQAAQGAFAGLFKLARLPVDLAVDGVDLEGEVILPDGRAQVVVTGGALSSGHEGKFVLKTRFKPSAATSPVTSLDLDGELTARMDTPRSFDRFTVTAQARAAGPQLPNGAHLDVAVTALREAQQEAYTVALRSGTKELLAIDIQLPPGRAPIAGKWKLDLGQADVAPFALGRPLPDFGATGEGTFSSDHALTEIHATGKIEAFADKLTVLNPEFSALGRLNFTAAFDVAQQGDRVQVTALDVQVAGAQPVASITALQALEFNPRTGELKIASAAASDLLRVTLTGLPVAWARPFLGDLVLTGDDVRGEFIASASHGGFSLRPVSPLILGNLNVAQAGKPLIRALDVSLSAQADYTPQGWQAEITDLSGNSAGAPLFKVTAKAGQLAGAGQALKATGNYEISLSGVLAQPVAGGGLALEQGKARGDFTASLAADRQVSLTLQLANLITLTHQALPEVAVLVRADVNAAGRITAQVPIVLTQGARRSDLTLGAVINRLKDATQIDAQLTGDAVYVQDLTLFSALAPKTAAAAAPAVTTPATSTPLPQTTPVRSTATPPAKPVPAAQPLWAGVTGELKLAFKKVIYSADFQATDIGGSIKITPSALTLENIRAALGSEGRLTAGGGLWFDAKQARPYELKADVAVTNIDPAPILKSMDPGKRPSVEGKFDLTTKLAGRAVDPAGFGETALGDVKLSSRGGTFHALDTKVSATVGNASKAAALVGLLGTLSGSSATVKYADRARAAADVTQQLGAIAFDQFNVVLSRDDKNNLEIKDLTLISPIVRLVGAGQITYVPGTPITQQPLLVNLQLGAREQLATDLRTLKLINGQADALGYMPFSEPLKLEGTLRSISTAQLERLLSNALTN